MNDNKEEQVTVTVTRAEGDSLLSAMKCQLEDDEAHYGWSHIRDVARLIDKLEGPLEKLRLDQKRRDLEEEIGKLQVRV